MRNQSVFSTANFSAMLELYFTDRLVPQRNASPHTTASYRDTFKLLLIFASALVGRYWYWTIRLKLLACQRLKEVDFLIIRDGKPWFLVEVKSSAKQAISKHLYWFQEKTVAQHAFQVVMDFPFVDADCFANKEPVKIPIRELVNAIGLEDKIRGGG